MKDEERADKHAEEYVMREDVVTENDRVPFDNGYGWQTVDFEKEVKKGYKDGFLAGLKAGRPQWHKITDWKKQEQFPDNTFEKYLVYVNLKYLKIKQYIICILDITEGYRQFYLDDGDDSIDPEDVIAWCEIPTFDKEIEK